MHTNCDIDLVSRAYDNFIWHSPLIALPDICLWHRAWLITGTPCTADMQRDSERSKDQLERLLQGIINDIGQHLRDRDLLLSETRAMVRKKYRVSFSNKSHQSKKEVLKLLWDRQACPAMKELSDMDPNRARFPNPFEPEGGASNSSEDDDEDEEAHINPMFANLLLEDSTSEDDENNGDGLLSAAVDAIKKLEQTFAGLDVSALVGSRARQQQSWFTIAENKAAEVMQKPIRFGGVTMTIKEFTIAVALQKPAVLLPAAVALLSSHESAVKSQSKSQFFTSQLVEPKMGVTGGQRRAQWTALTPLEKDKVAEMLAQETASYELVEQDCPDMKQNVEALRKALFVIRLGGLTPRSV